MVELLNRIIGFIRDPAYLVELGYPTLALIIFLETGALVFFLPGDSLLVTAGLYAAKPDGLSIVVLNALLIPCAIIGDATSYFIGSRTGPALFTREENWFFKPKYVKAAADFYERYGGVAIILARFMPLVRTFVPVVAGVAQMPYPRFAAYNVIGGAAWVFSMTMTGYILGNLVPNIGQHIEKVIVVVVVLSILPGIIGWFRRTRGVSPSPGA